MLQASFPSICIAFSQKNLLCKKIKEENNKPLARNNKGVRKLGMDTLHIDTLFLPAIILKIFSFYDLSLVATYSLAD